MSAPTHVLSLKDDRPKLHLASSFGPHVLSAKGQDSLGQP